MKNQVNVRGQLKSEFWQFLRDLHSHLANSALVKCILHIQIGLFVLFYNKCCNIQGGENANNMVKVYPYITA